MRILHRTLAATAVSVASLVAIGAAVAQTSMSGSGSERYNGIVNNDNNTYRTFPPSLHNTPDKYHGKAKTPTTTAGTSTSPPTAAATTDTTTADASTTPATLPPKADRR